MNNYLVRIGYQLVYIEERLVRIPLQLVRMESHLVWIFL